MCVSSFYPVTIKNYSRYCKTTLRLTIHLLKDIWVVSSLGPLGISLPHVCVDYHVNTEFVQLSQRNVAQRKQRTLVWLPFPDGLHWFVVQLVEIDNSVTHCSYSPYSQV